MRLRVVSWNLGGNFFAAQSDRAWHYLSALDPDIALLQEAKPPEWIRARYRCLHREKVEQWCSVIAGRNVSMEQIEPTAGSALASFLDGYVVSARATLADGRSLRLASVHTPAAEVARERLVGFDVDAIRRKLVKEVWYNDLAYWALRQELEADPTFIVSGDWNTARLFDSVPGYGKGATEFFDRAQEDGWFECLRKFNEAEQPTYFKKNSGPYELDHAFCSVNLAEAVQGCYVDAHAVTSLGLSDHAPVVIDLDL